MIPSNTDVLINFFSLHRRKDIWGETADQFNPDHFLPDIEEKRSKFAYIPFSYGYRNCLASKYAMINHKIQISYILMNYKIYTDIKLKDLKFNFGITTRLNVEHLVRLERR